VPHPARPEPVFDRTAANLRHGKGGKQRIVPITDTVDDDQIRAARWRPESGVNRPAEVLASVSDATRWR